VRSLARRRDKGVLVDLRLDVQLRRCLIRVEPVHLDFVIEVADVAHNGLIFHLLHVLKCDDVHIACRGHVDIASSQRVFYRRDFEAFHRRLQRIDWIDLRHDAASAHAAQRV